MAENLGRFKETVVEVSIKNSPTGARMLTKPYPKDNEPRTMALPADLVAQLADWITTRHVGPDDLLFATREGTPISRNTFRTRVWRPAVKASGVDFDVRVHDLRHAQASWLLAGGSDLWFPPNHRGPPWIKVRGGCPRRGPWRRRTAWRSCRGRRGGSGRPRSRWPWSV